MAGLRQLERDLVSELDRVRQRIELVEQLRRDPYPPLRPWERSRVARRRRDINIVRLARRGYSDGEIGELYGMHPKSVSRIIREQLRRP